MGNNLVPLTQQRWTAISAMSFLFALSILSGVWLAGVLSPLGAIQDPSEGGAPACEFDKCDPIETDDGVTLFCFDVGALKVNCSVNPGSVSCTTSKCAVTPK